MVVRPLVVIPRELTNYTVPQILVLYAADGSVIKIYGTKLLKIGLGLQR